VATLAEIRRSIGARTGQPFFRRAGAGYMTATGGTTLTLIDTNFLLQADDYWNGQSVYVCTQQMSRVINDFVQTTKTISWLEPITAVAAGNTYEIWSQFTPIEVHNAINQALRDAWPFFFDQVTTTLAVQEGMVNYALSSLTTTPKWLAQVWLEVPYASYVSTADASPGAQDYLKDADQTFTSDDVGKEIRIYDGTSAGDVRTVSALVSSSILQVSEDFTTTLDATSKYRLVDVTTEQPKWVFLPYWRTDKKNTPTYLRLTAPLAGSEGLLLRLVYEAEYEALSAETDDTSCPQEYVELAAIARLYLTKATSAPPSEAKTWPVLQRSFAEAAQMFALKNQFKHLEGTMQRSVGLRSLPSDYPF